jgi:hypothetical protein
VNETDGGDQVISRGRVEGGRPLAPGTQPLLYFRRSYAIFSPWREVMTADCVRTTEPEALVPPEVSARIWRHPGARSRALRIRSSGRPTLPPRSPALRGPGVTTGAALHDPDLAAECCNRLLVIERGHNHSLA